IIGPVKMARSAADVVLVHALDADLAEIASGISAGATESGIIEIHSVRKIKILRLPQINDRRNADPSGFEVRVGAGSEIYRVSDGNRRVVSQVRFKPVIGDTFARGRTAYRQTRRNIGAIYYQMDAAIVDGIPTGRADVKRNSVTRIDKDHIQREYVADDRRA